MRKFEKISREQWIKDTGIETRMTPKEDISSDGAQILVHSVVDVYDIIEYLSEDKANEENVNRIKKYLEVYGA